MGAAALRVNAATGSAALREGQMRHRIEMEAGPEKTGRAEADVVWRAMTDTLARVGGVPVHGRVN